ncbi:MAG: SARP family transcriptional regulator [Hungatella sp.]|nr:SARP family transcriptional regulator [Hungatella sp.]
MKSDKCPAIYVNTLGEFSIRLGESLVSDANNHSKKPWLLLEYLIIFRNREISPDELVELIWGDEDSANPNSALKTLMFRARKLLVPLGYPPQHLITQHRGSYAWNKNLETVVDIDIFESLASKALDPAVPSNQQLDYCLEALELYKGDFLAKSSWESWVVPLSTYYHNQYQKVLHRAVALLNETQNHPKIIEICQRGLVFSPYDEDLHYNLIYSLYCNGQQHEALEHYNHTTDMLYSEFAITPSEQLKSLYKTIRNTTQGVNMDLSLIQDSFMESCTQDGAYFCELAVFRDIYQIEQRTIERTGDSIYLCLLTLTDLGGNALERQFLNRGMAAMMDAICSSLRRGDVFSRFSVSQYVVLLPTATYENCETIIKRIIQTFHSSYTRKDLRVSFSVQSVMPKYFAAD